MAPLIEASTLDDLIVKDLSQKIVLIHGELAREQLMPKNFPFYNPEMHKKIYQLLEEKSPVAIIAATSRNPELAGGMYPFPLIEDGDFDIPSVYMTDVEGDRLLKFADQKINLNFQSFRLPSKACNIVARKGSDLSRRIVLCAHIDSKKGTPGALDNATGIVTLLALAEKLKEYQGEICVEIVALNGEDYYSAGGQKLYLELNSGKMDTILLAINLDVAGYYKSKTMYSLYDLPDHKATRFKQIFSEQFGFVEGPQWHQSDHMIFVQQGRPAVAITSENFTELSTHTTHTPKDQPELVDCLELKKIAGALYEFLKF
jgi:aminopeptidase YwaD